MTYNERNLKYVFGNIFHLFSMMEQVMEENENNESLYLRAWIKKLEDNNWHLTIRLSNQLKAVENGL